MPLTINVGLSRKASRNYNSTGTSINLSAELDPALLTRPAELQRQIEHLYQQAEDALVRQAAHAGSRKTPNPVDPGPTVNQRRAIASLAERLGIDESTECRRIMGAELNDLAVPQASQFIDHLKGLRRTARRS
jgi:hypothetical protein